MLIPLGKIKIDLRSLASHVLQQSCHIPRKIGMNVILCPDKIHILSRWLIWNHAGVDRAVILAEDYSASMGQPIVSNEEVKRIVELFPERFIGFASVDPREECAA